jgi:hypothetical protein
MLSVEVKLTSRNTLDTTTTSETSDCGLGNTLDVVTKNLAVTLGTTLAETLATFAACIVDVSQSISCMCVYVCVCVGGGGDGDSWQTRQGPRLKLFDS